jgi:hypothetical protein
VKQEKEKGFCDLVKPDAKKAKIENKFQVTGYA